MKDQVETAIMNVGTSPIGPVPSSMNLIST